MTRPFNLFCASSMSRGDTLSTRRFVIVILEWQWPFLAKVFSGKEFEHDIGAMVRHVPDSLPVERRSWFTSRCQ